MHVEKRFFFLFGYKLLGKNASLGALVAMEYRRYVVSFQGYLRWWFLSVWISAGYLAFSDGPGFVFCCLGTPSNRRLWILVITLLGFIPTYDNHIWWRTFYALPIWVNLLVWSEVYLLLNMVSNEFPLGGRTCLSAW